MPTRFPTGLNLYSPRNPLKVVPTAEPYLSGGYIWCEDFKSPPNWTTLADSTGTTGWGSSSALGNHGTWRLTTANTNADKVTAFPTPAAADTLTSTIGFYGSEWLFATAFVMSTSAAAGFAFGFGAPTDIDSAGTAGDMTASATYTGATVVVSKPIGSNPITTYVYNVANSTLYSVATLAYASIATGTRYKVTAHFKNQTLRVYLSTANAADILVGSTALPTNTTSNTALAPFLQTKQSGTGGAQINVVDYIYAWSPSYASAVSTGKNGRA